LPIKAHKKSGKILKKSIAQGSFPTSRMNDPPRIDDIPPEYQSDIAALERLDDRSLWRVARARQTETVFDRYQELLDKNREGTISDAERQELRDLRAKSDLFMLRKAHAAVLLKWRGHTIPPATSL
jgi:hypothetical protein